MTPYALQLADSLRREIAFFAMSQLVIECLVTVACLLVYIAAHDIRFRKAALVIPFLVSSGLVAIGRTDLLMHRAALFIRTLETGASEPASWEGFKAQLVQTKLLPLYDALALLAWGYWCLWSVRDAKLWLQKSVYRRFVTATVLLILVGIISILAGAAT